MAYEKLIDLLEEFQGMYLKAIAKQIRAKDAVASGALGDSVDPKLSAQPKVKVFGQLYHMKVEWLDYGDELDQGTQPQGKLTNNFTINTGINDIYLWLGYPNVIDRLRIQGIEETKKESLAFFISRNLQSHGLKPRNILDPALSPIHNKIKNETASIIAEELVFSVETMEELLKKTKN